MRKILVSVGILIVAISAGGAGVAHAENAGDAGNAALQAQIQALSQQVQQLQIQFNSRFVAPTVSSETATSVSAGSASVMSGTTTVPVQIQKKCFTFVNNLRIGDSNPDVSYLQQVLSDEGFSIAGEETQSFSFGETTAAAVVGLQEKYQSEVLSPSGLARGTGFVGKATRAKLNLLRKCPPIEQPPKMSLSIVPQGSLEAVQGVYYAVAFKVTGGSGNYNIDGSDGVPGLSWTGTYCPQGMFCAQVISTDTITLFGTPAKSGKFNVTVSARDREVSACPPTPIGQPGVPCVSDSAYGKASFTIIVSDGTIIKKNPPVISGASGPTSLRVNQEGTWTVKAYDPQGGSLTYSVVWGDEPKSIYPQSAAQPTTRNATQTATFTHTYQSAGGYTIVVSVANDYGQQAKTSMTVQVGGVEASNLKILAPNGGETWYQGSTYNITWDTNITKNPLYAKVSLLRDVVCIQAPCDAQEIPIPTSETSGSKNTRVWTISSIPQLVGKFKMKISLIYDPCPVVPGSNYRCMAMAYEVASDTSDTTFSIVAGTSIRATDSDNSPDYTWGMVSYPITPGKNPDLFVAGVGKGDYVGGGTCIYGTEPNPVSCKPTSDNFTTYYDHCASPTSLNEAFVNSNGKLGALGTPPPSGYECRNGSFVSIQQPSITVLSPNGGEQWQQGQTYQVTWQRANFNDEVAINLIDYTPGVRYGMQYGITNGVNIRTSLGQTGFSWTIPSSIPSGSYYKVVIGMGSVNAFSSNYFTITPLPPIVPSITVLSPNGGEQRVGGQTYDITWQSNGINNVKLAECAETPLLPTKYTCHELSFIPNAGISASLGKFSWYVDPNDPFLPGQIKIKIWDVSNASIYDESNGYFSIVDAQPSITVLSPNGGETWQIGSLRTITWSSSNLVGNAAIYLGFSDGGMCYIGTAPVSQGYFATTLGTSVYPYQCSALGRTITSGQYTVSLNADNNDPSSPDVGVAHDFSDAPFTISSQTTTGNTTPMSASEMASMLQSVQNTLDSIRRQLTR